MAQGVMEMKAEASDMIPTIEGRIHYFLDRFYLSRISIRMLIHQHCECATSQTKVSIEAVVWSFTSYGSFLFFFTTEYDLFELF